MADEETDVTLPMPPPKGRGYFVGYHEPPEERRVADEPWRVPARVGKVVLQADIGVIVEIDALRVPLHFGEYRRLMGRRKSDWSET